MSVSAQDIRALSLTGFFDDIPDKAMEQFIFEASKKWGGVKDQVTRKRLVSLHAADQIFRQVKAENGTPVDETPFSKRLGDLRATLPPVISFAL